jgi:hypothetical protein
MDMQQFNIFNKPKLLHFKLSNFGKKSVLLLLICIYYLCDQQNGFQENLFFGSRVKLLK